MAKYRWVARFGFTFGSTNVRFRGRDPFIIDKDSKESLKAVGVFSENSEGKFFYSAPAGVRLIDGTEAKIGLDGIVELEVSEIHPDIAQYFLNEIADPSEVLPPTVFTAGFDDLPPASLMPNAKP